MKPRLIKSVGASPASGEDRRQHDMAWNWKADPAAGAAGPRSPLSPFPLSPTMAPPPSLEEHQQDEAAAALAISDRRSLYLVNIFIVSAARFLNSFAAICEDKLADLHRRIVRVDSTLRLLEGKLSGTSSCGALGEGGEDAQKPEQEAQRCSLSSSSSPPPPPHLSDQPETSSAAYGSIFATSTNFSSRSGNKVN